MDISSAGITEVAGTHPITFTAGGAVDTSNGFVPPQISFSPNSGASDVTLTMDLGAGMSGLSQFAGSSNAVMRDQDGYTNGMLQTFTIDATGTIIGSFTNGTTQLLGQVALADFNNTGGLATAGDESMYTSRPRTPAPPSSALCRRGLAIQHRASGALEQSNDDLAQENTDMIVEQRGFQATGRVITTIYQMLQELVQLKQ